MRLSPGLFYSCLMEPSSETQGQSVGPREKARQTFSSTGGKAPGYRLSPDHFQMVKRMLAPDWAQKCFVLLCLIGEQHLLSSFREFVHDSHCLSTLARFVHQACACKRNFYFLLSWQETNELLMSRKNIWDAISRTNSICPKNILFLMDHNVS